ncbi:MAG: hypothetical protein EOP48_20755 [Sphingobacteriales bacterium]|nr:MAG: hypothetical protein EOP48_20755 [Sphingobacteriales bacterium]
MEFENLQKIWHTQSQQTLYVINEQAMQQAIEKKKKNIEHIAGTSEAIVIYTNAIAGIFLALYNYSHKANFIIYLLAGWMLLVSIYAAIHHFRRLKQSVTGTLTVHGSLINAISTAAKQIQLSLIMRLNVIPVTIFIIWGLISTGSSVILSVVVGVLMLVAFYFSGFEHKFYQGKLRELRKLKEQLEQEHP